MAHIYEIYRDRAGEYRARFKYNEEVIFSTEGYKSKESAINAIYSMKRNAPSAPVEDKTSDFFDLKDRLERAVAPASDRIVKIDHNSKEFHDFKEAFNNLKDSLIKSNDVGYFTSEELKIAKQEIEQLERETIYDWIRPEYIWQKFRSTLLWIAQEAAGAVIGYLALSALSSLAQLLGVSF